MTKIEKPIYQNHHGIAKGEIRKSFFVEITQMYPDKNYPINVMLLPNTYYGDLQQILNYYKYANVYLVEGDRKIHLKQKRDILRDGKVKVKATQTLHFINEYVQDVVIDADLDYVWLDYCGQFTTDCVEGTRKFLEANRLSRNGFLSITCRRGQEHGNKINYYFETMWAAIKHYNNMPDIPFSWQRHRRLIINVAMKSLLKRLLRAGTFIEDATSLLYRADKKNNKGATMLVMGWAWHN